ncbi:PAS domain S-box protein [Halorientalis halophila]|uniref:PAS domain S-box protein n=1 Tax=Halorientalis halophila TaxID=3108499 RepID=UPI0030094D36
MNAIARGTRLGISTLAVLLAASLLLSLWRHRRDATARSLLGVATVMFVGSVLHLLVVDLSGSSGVVDLTGWEPTALLWVVLAATASVVAGGIWSLFACQYTGRARRLRRVLTAGVAVVSIGSISIAGRAVRVGPEIALVNALTVGYILVGFLVTVGIFLLLWASIGQNAFPVREPLLLSAGIVVLLSGIHVAQVFDQPPLFPASVALSGVLFLVPVHRYPVFETLPAARVAGRDRVIEEMTDGVLVVDRAENLADLNPAAEALFGVQRSEIVDEPLSTILDPVIDPTDVVESRNPVRVELDGQTTLEITGTRVRDRHDRSVGTLLLCEDVTDRRIREEQLTLLGGFVADVVRSHMIEVSEIAADPADRNPSPDRSQIADRIWTTTTELTTLVARARDVERAIAAGKDGAKPVMDVRSRIETVVETVTEDVDLPITVDIPDAPLSAVISGPLFEVIIETVLEDAVEHASDAVRLQITADEQVTVTVTTATDGPKDPAPVPASDEAGISVIRLAVEQVGGSLSVMRESDARRRVTIRLPTTTSQIDPAVRGGPEGKS